jgi:hypothetical protein
MATQPEKAKCVLEFRFIPQNLWPQTNGVFGLSFIKILHVGIQLAFSGRVAIFLMMEAASTSETSVNLYQTTRRNNPEDSHFQW